MSDVIPPERIKEIDALYLDPSERCEKVVAVLRQHYPNPDPESGDWEWDILCFALEYAAMQTVAMGSEPLIRAARFLLQDLYNTHYSDPEKVYRAPDRHPKPRIVK